MTLEQVFGEFDLGLFLSYLFGLLGLYGIYLTYLYNRRKNFTVFWWNNLTLLDVDFISLPGFKATLKNNKIRKIHQASLYFRNEGSGPVIRKDVIKRIQVSFDSEVNILYSRVFSTNKFHSSITLNNYKEKVVFDFDFIEKKDYFRLEILYESDSQVPGIVTGKILEQEEIKYLFEINSRKAERYASASSSSAFPIVIMFIFFFTLSLEILLVCSSLHLSWSELKQVADYLEHPRWSSDYFVLFFVGLVVFLIPVWITVRLFWRVQPYYIRLYKIKNWFKVKEESRIHYY